MASLTPTTADAPTSTETEPVARVPAHNRTYRQTHVLR